MPDEGGPLRVLREGGGCHGGAAGGLIRTVSRHAPLVKIDAGASRIVLAALFAFAGTLHFVFTEQYVGTMPAALPWHRELVYLSGALEIAGGAGLLVPRTRRAAGIGLILLLIAVSPANVQMLLDARAAGASAWSQAALLLRLPLQLVLMAWVWRASRR